MNTVLAKLFKGDAVIWGVIATLSIFSLLAVYSSTGTLAFKYQNGNTLYYLSRHGFLLFVGIGIILITHSIPIVIYLRISKLLLFLSIPLLGWTLINGTSLNEASRWLTLPGTEISFQTSDFGKFALIMFIARFLAKNQGNIKDFKTGFRSIMVWILVVCALIFPANFSTSVMLFVTSLILLFIGRVKITYILYFVGIAIAGVVIFILITMNLPEQKQGRINTWKNRIDFFFSGQSEENFQVEQSKIAIASGSFFGKGPGNSSQRNFLPYPYSDFIFAIIIEEYGFIGAFIVLLLYLILIFRAGIIVKKSSSAFSVFLAMGLAISLVFQAFTNMAVVVNLIPVTGQTLPLISMGGTSIIFTSVAFGIILSISQSVNKTAKHEQSEAKS
ncbi:MAG: cell division protein FtsW [Bacteroidetes bacterium CG23_combo_of_CG06-09_8_20_14_all_32_9]|nr:MAG: cell division protein FtsW [Bacteroidetes bacterium CG23_combo_of_CG06-09_8_20_14_all_32_9]